MHIISSVLFCRTSVSSIKNSGLLLLQQLTWFLIFYALLLRFAPLQLQLINKEILFIALLVLFNLILLFSSKIRYFFAYNNAFFISIWLFTIISALGQLLLKLVSPYLISDTIIYMWALYFLFYSLFVSVWGFMMFINVLNVFITKPGGK
jgi:hypothetical protein